MSKKLCSITIVVQLLVTGEMAMIIGETAIFLIGGMVYLNLIVRNGTFDNPMRSSNRNYSIISAICAGVFYLIMALFMHFQNAARLKMIILYTALFFAVMMVVGRIVLGLLGKASDKNALQNHR